jgi:hypothetical protein
VDGKVIPGSWKVQTAFLAETEKERIRRWSIFCDTAWATPPVLSPFPVPAILEV